MSDWYVIRADANREIGLGHVMRCLALAETLLEFGLKCVFLTRFDNQFIRGRVTLLKGEFVLLESLNTKSDESYKHSGWLPCSEIDDAISCTSVMTELSELKKSAPNFVIVDHYALAAPWEKIIGYHCSVIVIDDLNDRKHNCNFLIDQTFGKNESSYEKLVNPEAKLLIGSEYVILRNEFVEQRRLLNRQNHNINKVLITLGGVDIQNYTLTLLNILKLFPHFPQLEVTIIISNLNPNREILVKKVELLKNVNLLCDVENMAEIMATHDLCIGAVGSTTWERFALKLPSILCVLAENQATAADLLKNEELIELIDINDLELEQLLQKALLKLRMPEYYKVITERIGNIIDCLGVNRIIDIILEKR